MGFVHGKNTYISVDSNDLSAFCSASNLDVEADEHDVTMYGATDYAVQGGLVKKSASISGTYDDSASGPKAVLEPLIGTVVTLVRRPEGTGTGLPQESVSVLVKKYSESNPVAGMITWSCDLTGSGAITRTTQS